MGITSQTFSTSWLILGLVVSLASVTPHAEARAFFVFGDSTGDNGNNNYLNTTVRADTPPYGIDYPIHRATGRFSNGEAIGSEPTLPYLSPKLTGKRLLIGATFASAGVGIFENTGIQFSNIIRITEQLEYFQQYQKRVSALVGPEQTRKIVNEGLVLMTLGANDFINNYFLDPFSGRSRRNTLSGFVDYLIYKYRKILLRVYGLGARRTLVMGIGPIGCLPVELAKGSKTGQCVEELQEAADLFNSEIVGLVNHLNVDTASDVFIAASIYENMDFISDPGAYGFVTSKIACCGQGPYNGLGLCTVGSHLCQHRDVYAFWDPLHLTQRANRIIFAHLLIGSTKYMNPMNLSTIMALDARP